MSINGTERDYDEGYDRVRFTDPAIDAEVEPNGGDTDPPDDDAFDAITHIESHGGGRSLTDHPAFTGLVRKRGRRQQTVVPEVQEVLSGIPGEEAAAYHDEAVQTRQLLPTAWDVNAVAMSAQPSQLVAERSERMTVQIFNNGPGTIYLGPIRAKASFSVGIPLVPGANLIMNNLGAVWGVVDPNTGGGISDARIVETWRTDNKGN